ncbi:MAG: hypothetical protein RI591_07965, partial [Dehalococcoidia bacterium]|nr:hypothetical protein [Dehalococcoidia bacterium]
PALASNPGNQIDVTPETPNTYYIGDTITYNVTISNLHGSQTMNVSDVYTVLPNGSIVDAGLTPFQLPAGESRTYYPTWVVDVSGVSAGGIVTATSIFNGVQLASFPDPFTSVATKTSLIIQPCTNVSITANQTTILSGDPVLLTITEENCGDVALTDPEVRLDTSGAGSVWLDENSADFVGGDTGSDGVLGVGETWEWQKTVNPTAATTYTAVGYGFDPLGNDVTWCADPGSPPVGIYCSQGEKDDVGVTIVDARISITQTDTNKVGDSHDFTVLVEKNDGSGWAAADGVSVTGSTNFGTITSTNPAATDGSGQMTITVNSSSVGTATVHASGTVNVGGINIAVATDGYGAYTVSNQKTWVDARISIVESGTNPVGTPHDFTVTVEQNEGTGWIAAPGVSVNGSTDFGTIWSTLPATTNASGQMTITVNSSVAGTATVHAWGTVNVSGIDIAVATNGYGAFVVDNVKTWEGGGQGCTPGFWKIQPNFEPTNCWCDTYDPGPGDPTLVGEVFIIPASLIDTKKGPDP